MYDEVNSLSTSIGRGMSLYALSIEILSGIVGEHSVFGKSLLCTVNSPTMHIEVS